MSKIDKKILDAYRDGELSACDVLDVEKHMSEDQREELVRDKKFEESLALNLGKIECPDAVWSNILSEIDKDEGKKVTRFPNRWFSGFLGLAASLIFAFVLAYEVEYHPNTYKPRTEFPADLTALNKMLITPAKDVPLNEYLAKKSIPLKFTKLSGHEQSYLGAGESLGSKEAVLLFECCGEPVKVVVAPKGSALSKEMVNVAASGTTGDYDIYLEGHHFDPELLNSFTAIL